MTEEIKPWPVVRQGVVNHPVATLQYLLRQRGHGVVVDGDFGPKTDAAVRAFQSAKHLTVDGVVGKNTWGALVVQVKKGDTGDAVRGVQEERWYRIGDDVAHDSIVDGIFGPDTDGFVRGFQGALGVAVDGIVGPITWRALVAGQLAG